MASRREVIAGAAAGAALCLQGLLSPRDSAQALTIAEKNAAIRPAIRRRAKWHPNLAYFDDSVESPVRYRGITIHHTVNGSNYSRKGAAAVVRSIYRLHAKTNGWGDIGYNFLIDKYGTIYEGRAGSYNGTPLPIQTSGYNTVLMGVAMIGTFTNAKPTAAALRSLRRLLTWSCWRYNINPVGRAVYRVGEDSIIDESGVRRAAGTVHTGPTIAGHRYFNKTACPGAVLNATIPSIRRSVAHSVKKAKKKYGAFSYRLRAPHLTGAHTGIQISSTGTYTWKAVSGAAVYEILKRPTAYGKYLFDPRIWIRVKRVTGTVADVTIAQGESSIVAVRALSSQGEQGAITEIGEVSRPLLGTQLRTKGGGSSARWPYKTQAKAPGGGYVSCTRSGSTLTFTVKGVRTVTILAPTAAGLGSFSVSYNGTTLRKVSLDADTDLDHRVVIQRSSGTFTGTIAITTLSADEVRLSGVTFIMPHVATDTTIKGHLTEYWKGTFAIKTTAR